MQLQAGAAHAALGATGVCAAGVGLAGLGGRGSVVGAVLLGASGLAVASRAAQVVAGHMGGLCNFTPSRAACTACKERRVSMQPALHVMP